MYKGLSDFYTSKEWVMFRLSLIHERLNENGEIICAYCGKPITNKYDCIGHHKIALNERNVFDAEIALNGDNVDLVHHICHNRIHEKLGYKEKEVYLVWGSPLSGKTSYVDSVKENGDLIVDIDDIWQCVSGCDRYVKPERLKSIVFGMRDYLIDCVRMRRGKWQRAYVIGGYPLISERERLIKSLGAREIFIDTPIDECIERLSRCSDGRNKTEWVKYILDWWEKSKVGTPPGA